MPLNTALQDSPPPSWRRGRRPTEGPRVSRRCHYLHSADEETDSSQDHTASERVEGPDLEPRPICSFLGPTPSCIEDLNPGGRLRGDPPGTLSGLTSVPGMLRIGAAARSTGRAPTASLPSSPALRSLTLGLPPPLSAHVGPGAQGAKTFGQDSVSMPVEVFCPTQLGPWIVSH